MKGRKEYICLVIWILSIVIPLMYRHYTLFEIICYSFFSLFLVIGATIDKLYFILPDEGAIALTIIGILYSIVEQPANANNISANDTTISKIRLNFIINLLL